MNWALLAWLALLFVGLYPVVCSGLWIAGGLVFRVFEKTPELTPPSGGWPPVTVLIPAYNEESVIATTVTAALELDYPDVRVVVLDDGSTDDTVAVATAAGNEDPRLEVVRDSTNRGKADRLNFGFERAGTKLVGVTDADTHMQPLALKLLVARLTRSSRIAAVAGAPHVTNRGTVVAAMQVLEASSIIGLIRRTQAVAGSVGVVAGVLGLFRRDAVIAVGGYRPRMATEDIDLSWRLLLAGWQTSFEPDALVGMQVPIRLRSLWAQRCRWARGGAEVTHLHLRKVLRWRNRRLWPLGLEASGSLAWVVLFAATTVVAVTGLLAGPAITVPILLLTVAWGIAVAVIATVQLAFALNLDFPYDRFVWRAFLLGPLYPLAFWIVSAAASLWAGVPALFRGPAERRAVWDISREAIPSDQRVDTQTHDRVQT